MKASASGNGGHPEPLGSTGFLVPKGQTGRVLWKMAGKEHTSIYGQMDLDFHPDPHCLIYKIGMIIMPNSWSSLTCQASSTVSGRMQDFICKGEVCCYYLLTYFIITIVFTFCSLSLKAVIELQLQFFFLSIVVFCQL